jgi:hypothetical protein
MARPKCPSCRTPTIWDYDYSEIAYAEPVRTCRCCGYAVEIKRRMTKAKAARAVKRAELETTLQEILSNRN